jgi:hypothetical protein
VSELSNPFVRTAERSSAYVSALLGLLGDRDPFEVLGELPPALAELTAGLDASTLAKPEREGKWSINEVVGHLADAELVNGYRIRLVLAQPGSTLHGYDQDLWARELGYRDTPLAASMAQLAGLRESNLRLLRRTPPEHLERFGLHTERGSESVRHIVRLTAGHDLVHRRQIARIRAALVPAG